MTASNPTESTEGRRWELALPYQRPPLSLNKRMHWAAERHIKDDLQNAVGWLLKGHKVPALDEATIWLEWTPGVARRRDTDNMELTRKACIDQIVDSGLIPDDTPEYVQRPENVILPVQRGLGKLTLVIVDRFTCATRGVE